MDTKNYTGIDTKKLGLKTENLIVSHIRLFFLLLFHAISGYIWININQVPPTWDAALHTILSFKLLHFIQANSSHFDIVNFLKISEYYPPFVHFTGVMVAFFTNESYKALQLLGLVYFLFSILVLYLYSLSIFKNKSIAFLAAFFYSFFITNYQQSRDFMLDIPSIFFILTALYYQSHSKRLTNSKITISSFIFVGIALLTKWTSVFFLVVPFVLDIIEVAQTEREKVRVILKNIIFGIAAICAICLPWYLVNIKRFIEIGKVTSVGELADPQNLLSMQNIFFNANLLSMYQLTYIGAALFIVSLVIFITNANTKQKWIILGTIVLNYTIFTFISNKNIRYTMPLTPFIAMIMAFGCYKLINGISHAMRIAGSFFIIWFVFSYFVLSFGIPIYPTYRIGVKDIDFVYLDNYPVKVIYDKNNWHNTEILNTTYSSSTDIDQNKDIVLLNLIDREYVNWYNLDPLLYSSLSPDVAKRVKLSFVPFIEAYKTDEEINTYLNTYIDYVLVPQRTIGLAEAIREYIPMQLFQTFMKKGENNFSPVASYMVPGNAYFAPDVYILYKKQAFQ